MNSAKILEDIKNGNIMVQKVELTETSNRPAELDVILEKVFIWARI